MVAGVEEKPWHITLDELAEILSNEFGVNVEKLQLLNGYDDLNYYVKEVGEHGREYLLKIYNEKYSQSYKEAEGEIELLRFLRGRQFPVPEIVKTLSGVSYYIHKLENSDPIRQRICRLQVFFPGQVLVKGGVTPLICQKVGSLLGRINLAMGEMPNPPLCTAIEKAGTEWDLGYLDLLRPCLDYIKDSERRSLAQRAIEFAKSKILPNLDKLPCQPIHGDLNEQNVIVNADGTDVVGVIDFGDSVVSKRVFDPAIATMYWTLFGTDPKQCAISFMQAYCQQLRLSKLELSLIYPCIIGRYAQSLVLGNYTAHNLALQGKPNDYVLITSKRGWDMLSILMNTSLGAELDSSFENL